MNPLTIIVALGCISVAYSTYHSSHNIMLESVPDFSIYGKIHYPQPTIYDLGEFSKGEHTPEVIKVIKTVQVKVPMPFPIKVPHKVPYPVAYKVPQIVKVPHIVKISHPVPIEVVKHVPVQQQQFGGDGSQGHGDLFGTGQSSFGGDSGAADSISENGFYGSGSSSKAGYGSYNNGGQIQSEWQGFPPVSYGASGASLDVPHRDFGGSAHGYGQSDSVNMYQQKHYSALDHASGYGEQTETGEHRGQEDYHSAQASQASILQPNQTGGNNASGQKYQVAEQTMEGH